MGSCSVSMGCGVSSFCPPLAAHSFASVAPAKAAASRRRSPGNWPGSAGASPQLTPPTALTIPTAAKDTSPEPDSLHHRYTLFGSPIFRSASCQNAYRALFITMSQDGETLVVEQYVFPPSPTEPETSREAEWSQRHCSNLELPPIAEQGPKRATSLPDLRSAD